MAQKSILVIDDNKSFVDGVETILEIQMEEIRVFKAYGGAEGLNLAISKKPDLIFLDMKMPGLSGSEVLQAILKRRIPTKVLILTGNEDRAAVQSLIKQGAAGYLPKPIKPKVLIKTIKTELGIG